MNSPNVARLLSVLRHEGIAGPVPFFELGADLEIMEAVVGHAIPSDDATDLESQHLRVESLIWFYRMLGYDYVPIYLKPEFPLVLARAADTAQFSRGTREWEDSTTVAIQNWADFESYRFPDPDAMDYHSVEYAYRQVPDDMGVCAQVFGGPFEWALFLMGHEGFSYALYDQPELIDALFLRLTDIVVRLCHNLLQAGQPVAFTTGDDMGHNTGVTVHPDVLRRYVFPAHRQLAEVCDARGVPYVLHSCGNLSAIMEDLVTNVGIDCKHSFQDIIQPVEHFHEHWGKRICVLGGVDMDLIARGSDEQVRTRTRHLLELLGNSGSWCLGTGNTVANYIPLNNYLAMLDEGNRWNAQWR